MSQSNGQAGVPAAAPPQLLASSLDPSTAITQELSPLFSTVPPEVRSRIFEHALRAEPDPTKQYTPGSFYYRPHHTAEPLISTTLLLTCRRIYLEIALLFTAQNALTYYWKRPPPTKPAEGDPCGDLARLSPEQLAVCNVQVFIQQFALEDTSSNSFQGRVLKNHAFRPSKLTITLRHGDWWWWEESAPLTLDARARGQATAGVFRSEEKGFQWGSWGRAVGEVEGLKEFVLELETVKGKEAELKEIVDVAQGWVFRGGKEGWERGEGMVCDRSLTTSWGWEGVDRFYELERLDYGEGSGIEFGEYDEDDEDEEEEVEEEEEEDSEHENDDDDDDDDDDEDDQEDMDYEPESQETQTTTAGPGSQVPGQFIEAQAPHDDEMASEEVRPATSADTQADQAEPADSQMTDDGNEDVWGDDPGALDSHERPTETPEEPPVLHYHVVEMTWKRRMVREKQ